MDSDTIIGYSTLGPVLQKKRIEIWELQETLAVDADTTVPESTLARLAQPVRLFEDDIPIMRVIAKVLGRPYLSLIRTAATRGPTGHTMSPKEQQRMAELAEIPLFDMTEQERDELAHLHHEFITGLVRVVEVREPAAARQYGAWIPRTTRPFPTIARPRSTGNIAPYRQRPPSRPRNAGSGWGQSSGGRPQGTFIQRPVPRGLPNADPIGS